MRTDLLNYRTDLCAHGSAKLPNGLEKFFLRLVDLNVDIVRKILDFYMRQSISTNWIIGQLIFLVCNKINTIGKLWIMRI